MPKYIVIKFLKNTEDDKNFRSSRRKRKRYIQKISDENKTELLVRQKYSPEDNETFSLLSTYNSIPSKNVFQK